MIFQTLKEPCIIITDDNGEYNDDDAFNDPLDIIINKKNP